MSEVEATHLRTAPDTARRSIDSTDNQFNAALDDLRLGLANWRLWLMLGWVDIRQRYRRAFIGPFWITLSMGIMVATLGFLYAHLFKIDVPSFLPFVAAGFATWFFISATINESTLLYIQAEGIIRNTTMPLSIHLYRMIWRNLLVLAHNAVVMLFVYAVFGGAPLARIPLVALGLVLLTVNLTWIGLVTGIVCTRFRDAPPIIANLIQIVFFVTPILFKPSFLADKMATLAFYNPFFHLVDVLRAPLLDQTPQASTYAIVAFMAVAGWAFALLFYKRLRRRIAYWL
jgi:lipopolysaccharide transport system permease protein